MGGVAFSLRVGRRECSFPLFMVFLVLTWKLAMQCRTYVDAVHDEGVLGGLERDRAQGTSSSASGVRNNLRS